MILNRFRELDSDLRVSVNRSPFKFLYMYELVNLL